MMATLHTRRINIGIVLFPQLFRQYQSLSPVILCNVRTLAVIKQNSFVKINVNSFSLSGLAGRTEAVKTKMPVWRSHRPDGRDQPITTEVLPSRRVLIITGGKSTRPRLTSQAFQSRCHLRSSVVPGSSQLYPFPTDPQSSRPLDPIHSCPCELLSRIFCPCQGARAIMGIKGK